MDSILNSIKSQLGIHPEEVGFDNEIVLLINQAFSTLHQLGLGPAGGFFIVDSSLSWTDYNVDAIVLQWTKAYVYLKVKIIFDPPQNASYLNSITEMINEYEWRIREHIEDPKASKDI